MTKLKRLGSLSIQSSVVTRAIELSLHADRENVQTKRAALLTRSWQSKVTREVSDKVEDLPRLDIPECGKDNDFGLVFNSFAGNPIWVGGICRGQMTPAPKPELWLYLLAPRGYCAGVARAIEIVEAALVRWGPPVYVRHEIVHNQHVVNTLQQKGAIFVDELNECPEDRPVVLSAHGVSKGVHREARKRNLMVVDAVCPLVSKVHVAIQRNKKQGLQSVMIGHAGHPETIGTLGQLPEGEVLFVESVEDVEKLQPDDPDRLAYVTQTTLSVDETERISSALSKRFPRIRKPHKSDICYATTNRQNAVKQVAPRLDALFVVGSPNSSNSNRMVEVGRAAGCNYCRLVATPECIAWDELSGMRSIGLTAGASAPEVLLQSIKSAFEERYDVTSVEADHGKENVVFNLPRVLRSESVAGV